jgi:hypothetical protein
MVKQITLLCLLISLTGCAYVNSNTQHNIVTTTYQTNGVKVVTLDKSYTHARATTWFDSQAQLAKFRNSIGGPTNDYTQGSAVSGLNESSSTSNVVAIINAASAAAAKVP